jgi:hypothetical protein
MNWRDVPMPGLIARLPRDARGFPVPAFVFKPEGWKSGDPLDMRVLDLEHHYHMAKGKCCGVCGGTLYSKIWFIGGPMCLANRIFGDAGMHRECAEYALQVCPLLSRSGATYNDRPSGASGQDPNALRTVPPYQVLLATRGYTVITHDPQTRARLPKPLLHIQPWQSCEFRNNDGTPTTDTYAVITNQRGTGLYCFDCIGKGKPAITFDPECVAERYCPTCARQLATPVEIEVRV